MKQHEREFFVYMIRSGRTVLDYKDIVIHPFKIQDIIDSHTVYIQSVDKCYRENLMDEEEMTAWMKVQGLWTKVDDNLVDKMKKDIEELKVKAFKSRLDKKSLKYIKANIRGVESKLQSHLTTKVNYLHNTVEGISETKRLAWLIHKSAYLDNKPVDEDDDSIVHIVNSYNSVNLSDKQIRELARNEPWRSSWMARESVSQPLFLNPDDTELTIAQKSLLVWARTYDNVRESMDCPPDDVIEDDDMLDGWFVLEERKRIQEQKERSSDAAMGNEKIANSQEVFVMANNTQHAQEVYENNSFDSRSTIKQRSQQISQTKGDIDQVKFLDEQVKLKQQEAEKLRR